jgi:PAS domain S-box-containing protein
MTGTRARRGRASLRTVVATGTAVLVGAVLVALSGTLLVATRIRDTLDREARTLVAEQQNAAVITREVERQQLAAADHLADPRPETLQRFRQHGERVYAALRQYLFRPLSLDERLQVERVKELHEALEVQARLAFDARGARDRRDAMYAAAEPLQDALDRFVALRAADYQRAYEHEAAMLRTLYTGAVVLGVALLAVVALVLRFLRRRVLAPVDALADAAARIGAGDLAARVTPTRDDEIGRVAASFDAMAAGLEALQQRLQRSEERYRRLVELSPDAIVVHAGDRIVLANATAVRQFGEAGVSDLVGRALPDLAHPVAPPAAVERLRGLLAGPPRHATIELPFSRAGGEAVHGEVVVAPFDYEGERARLVVVRDVTDRKRAEARLHEAEDHLRHAQKMDAVGRLAGGVAHDFNNLLTIIVSYSELLLAGMPPEDPRREDVDEIRAAADRAGALTRQLLVFSRRQVRRLHPLDLNAVVGGMTGMLRRLVVEDIELRTVLAESLPSVRADAGQIEQVVLNLVVNARDAMTPGGGRLTIRTAAVEVNGSAWHRERDVPVGRYVVLSVEDTGCGLDDATRARMFEPFFTTKDVGKGTGLGLATVWAIVQQSGGYIDVQSEVGRGTLFEVLLPALDGAAPAPAVAAPNDARGGSETVLVVEDDDAVRWLAARVLRRYGYHVLEASGGDEAEALLALHGSAIDLLLTDVVMPGIGGRELARRAEAIRPGLRVLFTSGYTEDEILLRGVALDARSFLPKPYTPGGLVQAVRDVLDA